MIALSLKDEAGELMPSQLPAEPQEMLDLLIAVRRQARERKDFQLSDRLREALREEGIILDDTPRGARWRLV
jgi:cysteinyl-tRNA synthetase